MPGLAVALTPVVLVIAPFVGISCFASALQIYLPHLAQTKACLECSRTGPEVAAREFNAEVVKEDSKLLQSNS